MTDYSVERRALVNTLQHAGQVHGFVAEFQSYLEPLARELAAARFGIAEELAAEWQLEAISDIVTEAEREDVKRRGESRVEELGFLMLTEERKISEVVEDLPADAIDPDRRANLLASAADAGREIFQQLLTLRASAERDHDYELGFTLGRKSITPDAPAKPPAHIFKLWYGTDRSPIIQGSKLTGFSSDRAEQVYFGACEVTIPKTHKVGSTGSPWWHRIGRGDDRLRLATLAGLDTDAFWAGISEQLSGAAEWGDAVVFIHGFNVGFKDAALRAAQIGADLALGGAMAFFSWPSRGRLLGYSADEATIEASEPHITQFLTDFAERSGARALHIIAHSMGNRGLLRAVTRIATNAAAQSSKPFGQIILAAPDVDSGTFRGLAAAYPLVAARTTLYVSQGDLAVRASRLFHGADRIGFAPPIAIVEGIDTVNVTGVDLSLLGHGYVGENRSVIQDMYDLLARGTEPARRAMVRALTDADGRAYWEIAA